MKKVLSILTSLAMVLSMLPAIAFAAGTQENPNEQNAKSVLAEGGGGNSSASTAGPPQSKNSQTNSAKASSKTSTKTSSKSSSKAGAKTSAETSSKTGAAATSAATATTKTTTKSSKTATASPELTISGGTLDTDYTYDESSHVITILTDAALTISGTTQTDRIVVSASTANITLDGLTLKNNNWSTNPFDIGSSNTTITLAGGSENTITAPNGAAGIYVAPSGKLTIEGDDTSSLTANGDYGAGIGGYFNHESSGDITIKGGNITVTNGIGNARGGNGGTYTVSGGSLNVDYITSGNGNGKLVIENGASVNVERETLEATVQITCGTLLHNGDVTVGGEVTLLSSVTSIASGKSLTVQEGGKLSIPAGANIAIDGDIVNNGEIVVSPDVALTINGVLYNNGSLTNNGTISGSGTFIGNDISAQSTGTSTINTAPVGTGTIDVSCGNVTLLKTGYWSGDTLYSFDYTSPITLTGTTSEYIVKIEDGLTADIALKDLSMDASNIGTSVVPIDLTGGKINLSFSGTNTLKPTRDRPCFAVQNG